MRELDLEEFVDEIYIDHIENEDTKYIFFLGAGCSKSSGIKLAGELAKEWYDDLKNQKTKFDKFNKANDIEDIDENEFDFGNLYFEIFEALYYSPITQQKQIQKIIEDKSPSLGYYVLAELMQKSSFNTVITTNFDNLIQDALIYSGNKRALVITHQDLAKLIKRDGTPLLTKIHGDAHMHPFNNSKDTKEIPEALKNAIQGLFHNAKVIFIGYKGNDKSILNLLEGCNGIDQVYWCGTSIPVNTKLGIWWKKLDTNIATFVKERDFDKILNLIKSKFDLPKPNFEKIIEKLKLNYEKALVDETEDLESIGEEKKTFVDYLLLGNTYYDQEEYDKAINAFSKAIELNPKNDSAYYNLGTSLSEFAKIKDNDEELYIESIEKYSKAIELNPKHASAYNNWATVLLQLAKIKDNDEELYYKSFEKYSKAIELNPKNDSAYYNWGNALSLFAKIKDNDEKIYYESFEKYSKAIGLNPKNDSAYYNWGTSLSEFAKIKDNDEELYNESFEKYSKAIELNLKNDSAYYNWGSDLLQLAKIKDNDEELLNKSIDKFSKSFELGGHSYNLACVYSLLNKKDESLKYLEISLQNKEITTEFMIEDNDLYNFKKDKDFLKLIEKYK